MSRLAATVTLVAIADMKESLKCPVSLGLRKKEKKRSKLTHLRLQRNRSKIKGNFSEPDKESIER